MNREFHTEPDPCRTRQIHVPFFLTAIGLVLTLGATWGAWLLVRIAASGTFTAVGLHEVNAHGHAQIFGWVGVFLMGLVYRAWPGFWKVSLQWPALAWASLVLMALGIVLRTVSETLLPQASWWIYPGGLGGGLEVAAITIFLLVLWRSARGAQNGWALADAYLMAGAGCFLLQAVADVAYFAATAMAADREALLVLVSTWQGPLRDLQIHGFGTLMVLGVTLRVLPAWYGLRPVGRPTGAAALLGILAGLLCEAAGLLLMRTQGHAWAALWYSGVLLLLASALALVCAMELHRPVTPRDPSLKFLRAACLWFLLSLSMQAALPAYQFLVLPHFSPDSEAAAMGFSHAYYGAIRHAIAVGFLSLMIVGLSSRAARRFREEKTAMASAGTPPCPVPPAHAPASPGATIPGSLWSVYLLLNLGCAMRVTAQTLTDFTDNAFPVAGMSGLLEVLGLTLWSMHLLRELAPKPASSSRARGAGQHAVPPLPHTAEQH
ncbi:MAG: NnrS family protein [Candidatus Hydrogenedentes bacterium]|nr:NnrS family protein [Candidatus Hydrogenedentota bacterium]